MQQMFSIFTLDQTMVCFDSMQRAPHTIQVYAVGLVHRETVGHPIATAAWHTPAKLYNH